MAEAMFALYNGSPYENQLLQVMTELSKTTDHLNKMNRIKDNLVKVAENLIGHIKNLQELIQQRENERIYYDHYRVKLANMEKEGKGSSSTDPDLQSKYARNQSKFDQAKSKFELLSTQLNEDLVKIENRVEKVKTDLTFKFSKEVQMKLYKEMNQVFFRLRDIEGEMVEKAHLELVKKQEFEKKEQEAQEKAQRALDDEHGGQLDKYSDPKYLAKFGTGSNPYGQSNDQDNYGGQDNDQ